MARSRQAATSTKRSPDPPEPQPAVKSAAVRTTYLNSGLILLIAIELGLFLLAQQSFLSRATAILALLGTAAFLVRPILPKILDILNPDLKAKQKALLESPRFTRLLVALAGLLAVPAIFYAPWTLSPPPLLRILPGPEIFNAVSQADVRDLSVRYVLRVTQGGKLLTEADVTGAGSIYVGKNPKKQKAWIDKAPAEEQREELSRYLDVKAFVDRWMAPAGERFVKAPLRRGCVQIDLWYVPRGGQEERVGHKGTLIDAKVKQIFLEAEDDKPACKP